MLAVGKRARDAAVLVVAIAAIVTLALALAARAGGEARKARTRAAAPEVAWAKGFGARGDRDHAWAVTIDAAGNTIVAGTFAGTADFGGGPVANEKDGSSAFVAKYAPDGRHLWSRTAAGAEPKAVATDAAGNVYVAGSLYKVARFGEQELRSAGETDAFVAAYGADGALAWCKRFGGPDSDRAVGIFADELGAVVAITFAGTMRIGEATLASAGLTDVALARVDAAGAMLWAKRYGGPSWELADAVARGRRGTIIVAGEFDGTADLGGIPLKAVGERDVFVATYTARGEHVWSKRFGSEGLNPAKGLAVDTDGAVVVAGSFFGKIDFGRGAMESTGQIDAFVAKLSEKGDAIWSKHFGGVSTRKMRAYPAMWPADSQCNAVVAMANGDVVCAGMFAGTGDIEGQPIAGALMFGDLVVVAYSGRGQLRWLTHVGNGFPSAAARDASGALVIAGAFDEGLPFAGHPLAGGGAFVARFAAR